MKSTDNSLLLERRFVGLLGLILFGLIIWGVAANHWFQVAYLLGALALALGAIVLTAAWQHGFRWFLTRGAWRLYAWLLVGLLSVIVLFYTEERWRGQRAWAALQREAAARGESLALASIEPPPVPAEQNFALAPGVASVLGYGPAQPEEARRANPFYHGRRQNWPTGDGAWQQPRRLGAWQQFFRQPPQEAQALEFPAAAHPQGPAADVLLALSRFETNLASLRAASPRPGARFPVDYAQGFWALNRPNAFPAETFFSAAHVLSLRAAAELEQQQSDAALQDIELGLRLVEALRQEPFYMVQESRAEMTLLCLQPIWEGLAAHRWSASQLVALENRLGAMNWLADFRLPARGESLMLMDLIDQFQAFQEHRPSPLDQQYAPAEQSERFNLWLAGAFYPSGWLYQDKAWIYRFYQQHDSPLKILSLGKASASARHFALRRVSDPMFLVLAYPRLRYIFEGSARKFLFLHTACEQAQVACALERYRLSQGHYPDSLEALVPAWMPQVPRDMLDPSGAPLRYSRTQDGGFQLYSVGWNQVDDHGQPSPPHKRGHGVTDVFPRLTQGDWVWRQPGQS